MSKADAPYASARFMTVGTIRRTIGLSGEVLVASTAGTSFSELVGCSAWIVPPVHRVVALQIAHVDVRHDGVLVGFASEETGFSRDDDLRGRTLVCARADVPRAVRDACDPKAAESRWLGRALVDSAAGPLGTVDGYLSLPGNDCLVVHGPYGEVLVPLVVEVTGTLEPTEPTLTVTLPHGLLALNHADSEGDV